MLNTNPNFSSPRISASLSGNPELIYPRPVHIPPPSFTAPVPFPCMNIAIDPNRISLFSNLPIQQLLELALLIIGSGFHLLPEIPTLSVPTM